jgi:hypothetical protein
MEAIKDPGCMFSGDAATIIRHGNHQRSIAAGCLQPDMTARRSVRKRVLDQITQSAM